jgi:predicted phosphate transport protein (TIGR00153 family)
VATWPTRVAQSVPHAAAPESAASTRTARLHPATRTNAAGCPAMVLDLFRKLLPRNERFVEQICRHSSLVVEGMVQFRGILASGNYAVHCKELFRLEEAADEITADVINDIHRSFITPFDRAEILQLVTALDDTIDLMKDAARRLGLYKVTFTPEMLAMADCAVRATTAIRDALPALNAIGRNIDRLNEMQRQVRTAEGEADDLLQRGLRNLFDGPGSAGEKLTGERVYELIEAVVDRCEDVADVVAGIVVEQV